MERIAHLQMTPKDHLYNYTYEFPFEKRFSPVPSTVWMQDYWYHSITFSAIYALVIFGGRKIMAKRQPFKLDNLLTLWNGILAVFSIMGSIRMSPEFFYTINNFGFQHSICTTGYAQLVVTGFWTNMFALSKALELIDTVFIVLRKKPLIFLHWYHHITVLIYTWHAYKEHTAAGRWFIWMNFHVHAFMYSYYTLRALGVRVPKKMAMVLTSSQIVQMVIGCYIGIQAYMTKRKGQFCQQSYENLYFSFGIYFTYFLLFANFFYRVYLSKGNRHHKSPRKGGKEQNGRVDNGDVKTQNGHIDNGDATIKNGHATTANGHTNNVEKKAQ